MVSGCSHPYLGDYVYSLEGNDLHRKCRVMSMCDTIEVAKPATKQIFVNLVLKSLHLSNYKVQ